MTNLRLKMDAYEIEESELEEIEDVWFTKKERFSVLKEIQDFILVKHFWADGYIAQFIVSATKGYVSFDNLSGDLEDGDFSIASCVKEHVELLSDSSKAMVERVINEGWLNEFLEELNECYIIRGALQNVHQHGDFQ